MESDLLEVKSGVLHTFDGTSHEVHGGAYLPPEAYLTTHGELERLRRRHAAHSPVTGPALVLGAALLGLAAGFWLGRRTQDD